MQVIFMDEAMDDMESIYRFLVEAEAPQAITEKPIPLSFSQAAFLTRCPWQKLAQLGVSFLPAQHYNAV